MKFLFESEKGRDDAVQELLGLELVATFRLSFGDPTGSGSRSEPFSLGLLCKARGARSMHFACLLALDFHRVTFLFVRGGWIGFLSELIFLFCLDCHNHYFVWSLDVCHLATIT